MSWNETSKKEEKIKFIGDWLKQEFNFAELCRRYHISRNAGYELVERFKLEGERAFEEKSRTRHFHPNETDFFLKQKIIDLKIRYLSWGPQKLRDWLVLHEPHEIWPAVSTVGEILKRQGLVKSRKRKRRVSAYSHPFLACERPNRVWSTDFKGHFRLGNGRYCYPLTVTDNYSRFLLSCHALSRPTTRGCMKQFKRIFEAYGLPDAIRTDNGSPFASVGVGGLSELSVWWLKLGILPERIEVGRPEQNGRHERMHRTLKAFIQKGLKNNRTQQKIFDAFIQEFNYERPHQGLKGKRPMDMYERSNRLFPNKIPEINYPEHFEIRKVRSNGEIKIYGKRYYLSELLQGEPVGLKVIDEGRAMIYFSKLKLGIADAKKEKIEKL